jgi:hypothetical protein
MMMENQDIACQTPLNKKADQQPVTEKKSCLKDDDPDSKDVQQAIIDYNNSLFGNLKR